MVGGWGKATANDLSRTGEMSPNTTGSRCRRGFAGEQKTAGKLGTATAVVASVVALHAVAAAMPLRSCGSSFAGLLRRTWRATGVPRWDTCARACGTFLGGTPPQVALGFAGRQQQWRLRWSSWAAVAAAMVASWWFRAAADTGDSGNPNPRSATAGLRRLQWFSSWLRWQQQWWRRWWLRSFGLCRHLVAAKAADSEGTPIRAGGGLARQYSTGFCVADWWCDFVMGVITL